MSIANVWGKFQYLPQNCDFSPWLLLTDDTVGSTHEWLCIEKYFNFSHLRRDPSHRLRKIFKNSKKLTGFNFYKPQINFTEVNQVEFNVDNVIHELVGQILFWSKDDEHNINFWSLPFYSCVLFATSQIMIT